jgi:hypothetical protein
VYLFVMTATARKAFKWTVFLVVSVALIALSFVYTLNSPQFRNWLQSELTQRSGYDIRFSDLGLEFPWNIVAEALEVSQPGQFQLTASRVAVTITPADLIAKTVHRIDVEKPLLELDVQALTKAAPGKSAEFAVRRLNVRDGTVAIKNGDEMILELPDLHLSADNLNLDELSGISLRAGVPALDGEAELHLKGRSRELESDLVVRPRTSRGLLVLPGAKASGPEILRLTAQFKMPENQPASLALESKFQQLPARGVRITGSLSGRAEIDTKFAAASFTGRADVADFPTSFTTAARSLPAGTASADFAGAFTFAGKILTLKSLQLSSQLGRGSGAGEFTFGTQPEISSAKLALADIPLGSLTALLPAPASQWAYKGIGQLEVTLRGSWHAPVIKGVARAGDVEVRAANFTAHRVSLAAPFEWAESALRIREAKVEATRLAFTEKTSWQAATERIVAVASVEYKTAGPLKVSGRLDLRGGNFSSPDSSRVGENFVLRGPVEVSYDARQKTAGAAGKLSAESGEILWGKFYGDLKTQKPSLDFAADYTFPADSLQLHRAELAMASIGTLAVDGAIERVTQSPQLRFSARSANFSPDGFYKFFLLETFKTQYPLLDRLAVGGRMAFQTELHGPIDRLAVEGELSLQGGELRAKSKDWQIGPIALRLPVEIFFGEPKQRPGRAPPFGALVVERMRFGQHSMAPIKTAISLTNNQLHFPQPLVVKFFGGEIALRNLAWPDLINYPRRVSFSAEMKRLQLDEITQALDWPRFSGTLTGSIPGVHSTENTLRTDGEIDAQVFGGRVRVGQLEIENPFSSLASIKLDAGIESIELEQLSKTFAFGRISGILEGTINDLVITQGQPAEMRVDLRSVERSGVEQRISVEALNNITVVSSGQEAGALYGGLAGFFDSFRYSKLGFKATLRNDRLTLRGVESDGDKEYLVVGSWLPPTVNIISHTQTIAFSELLRRLERIKSEKPDVK